MKELLYKVYIHARDGVDVWIPAQAQKIVNDLFQIISCESFDPRDEDCVFQFIPGDIVKVADRCSPEGQIHMVAKDLIKAAPGQEYNRLVL